MTKPNLNRQLALSALCGLCFALVLDCIYVERITPLVIVPSLPGLIAAAIAVGLPPCGGRPPEGLPIDTLFPYVAMWLNAAFYSVATFTAYQIWIARKRYVQYKINHSSPGVVPQRTAGNLLDYGEACGRETLSGDVTLSRT